MSWEVGSCRVHHVGSQFMVGNGVMTVQPFSPHAATLINLQHAGLCTQGLCKALHA